MRPESADADYDDFVKFGETKESLGNTQPNFNMGNGYNSIFAKPMTPNQGITNQEHDVQIQLRVGLQK